MKHVSVTDAHELQQHGHTYVDVRSTIEFAQGHPAGAVNVPIFEPDEHTGQMQPNPDFVRVMKGVFAADAKLLIGCQMGGRSARAAAVLESFGFSDVTNVLGGFGGAGGGRMGDPGWHTAGLPTATESEPGQSYTALVAKADSAR